MIFAWPSGRPSKLISAIGSTSGGFPTIPTLNSRPSMYCSTIDGCFKTSLMYSIFSIWQVPLMIAAIPWTLRVPMPYPEAALNASAALMISGLNLHPTGVPLTGMTRSFPPERTRSRSAHPVAPRHRPWGAPGPSAARTSPAVPCGSAMAAGGSGAARGPTSPEPAPRSRRRASCSEKGQSKTTVLLA